MPQDHERTTYAMLAQLRKSDVQNIQDFASIWGPIKKECRDVGAEIEHSYVVLGQYDYLVIVDAASQAVALKASLIMERQGLDVQSMEIIPTEQFGDIVKDM